MSYQENMQENDNRPQEKKDGNVVDFVKYILDGKYEKASELIGNNDLGREYKISMSSLRKHYDAFLKIYDKLNNMMTSNKIELSDIKLEILRLYYLIEYDAKRRNSELGNNNEIKNALEEIISYLRKNIVEKEDNSISKEELKEVLKRAKYAYEMLVALGKSEKKR